MVFVFFGFVATVGTRFAHDGSAGGSAWLLGAVMGSLAAAILMANNIRDLETDQRVGKRTLAVMIGPVRSRRLFSILLIAPFAVIAVSAGLGWIPALTGISVVLLPLVRPLVGRVYRETSPEALIGVLGGTARLQLLVALAVSAGALAT